MSTTTPKDAASAMPTALEQLKRFSVVVADTGDFNSIQAFAPRDATTNPTLILKAVQKPEYRGLLERERACGSLLVVEHALEPAPRRRLPAVAVVPDDYSSVSA